MTARVAATMATMTRRSTLGLALASALPLAAGARVRLVSAEPVPDTWMVGGDSARTGAFPGPGPDLGQEIVELWRIDERQAGYFSDDCGVCDGIAYYVPVPNGISDEIRPVIAVDARTGEELWRHDPPVTEPPAFFGGKPAIADGVLMVPTYGGLLMGLDAQTGEELWVFDLGGHSYKGSCPAVVDGVVYISDDGAVNAIKLGDTPEFVWKTPLGDGMETIVSPTVSVDGNYVVVSSTRPYPDSQLEEKTTDIHVLGVADGAEAFRFQFRNPGESYQFAVQQGMLYSRADRMIQERSFFFSMSLEGEEQWSSRTAPSVPAAHPAVSGDLVYAVVGETVSGFDAATGESVWTSTPLQTLDSEIALIDGALYVGAAPSTPFLYALDPEDGTLLGTIEVPFEGARVVGTTDGVLVVRSGVNLVGMGNAP